MSAVAPRSLREIAGLTMPRGELRMGERGEPFGVAELYAGALDEREVDICVFPPHEAARVKRLAALGARGVTGFDGGGELEDGRIALVKKRARRTVADLPSGERTPGPRALAIVTRLARVLDALESEALHAGPLRPNDVVLEEDASSTWIVAEPLARALAGDHEPRATGTAPSPRWTPPEQADGAPWDAAANRYVLGLVAYRLLAGEHPFAGASLRHVHDAIEAPPFAEEVARALTPGVQAFVLSLLKRDRPKSARDILRALDRLDVASPASRARSAAATASSTAAVSVSSSSAASAPLSSSAAAAKPARATSRSTRRGGAPARKLGTIAIVAAGSAAAALAFGLSPERKTPAPAVTVRDRAPITGRTADTCAPCHAKQVEEWKRSVMAFASKSPLYRALESAVEEQVGQDDRCPGGAGILRKRGAGACVDPASNLPVTGSGGEHWCVHCHAPLDQLSSRVPAWSGTDPGNSPTRRPLGDVLSREGLEGITCVACHTTVGPVDAHARGRATGAYEGNPIWTSTRTGQAFPMRPEDGRGVTGIANSGYRLAPSSFFLSSLSPDGPTVHAKTDPAARSYLRSSEFCGACHDVRLFGTDVLGQRDRGEHFKRLRNAYSEWRAWSETESRAGRTAATCQSCHMSDYPGVCVAGAPRRDDRSSVCPPGTGFVVREPRENNGRGKVASHYFTGVEVPFTPEFPEAYAGDRALDEGGIPLGIRARRDLLLKSTFSLDIEDSRVVGGNLEVPVVITNVGAGHRVPAGFSQEREFWLELSVTDARGNLVYEVGRIDSPTQDLKDKAFLRVTTGERLRDGRGRPLGMFGADVADGPDVPRWSPDPIRGGREFRGRGLVNFQNGFLRCVRCVGVVARDGSCQPGPGQGATRADRFEDGDYDADTGECRSNLFGGHELFETYFPIGSLDASRGVLRAPDSIIDTRSAPPGVPLRYTYVLAGASSRPRPFQVQARLRFRAFPPFLVRAFVAYERERAARGERPSGAQMNEAMLDRLDIVDLVRATREVP